MSNPRADRVRDIAKLGGRSARLKRRQFIVEGPQAVREALVANQQRQQTGEPGLVSEVFATAGCLDRLPELVDLSRDVPLRLATDEVLAAMGDTVTPQGVLAVCRMVDVSLQSVLAGAPRLVAVLAQMRDPGNAGTVLRAADAAGADAVIFSSSSVDVYNPKTVRSTAGSLFHLPVVTGVDLATAAAELHSARIALLAADGYGTVDLDELQDRSAGRRLGVEGAPGNGSPVLEAATAWMFGNEAHGLSESELALADHRVAVPLYGQAESLNVAVAAAVCLYASAGAQRRPAGMKLSRRRERFQRRPAGQS